MEEGASPGAADLNAFASPAVVIVAWNMSSAALRDACPVNPAEITSSVRVPTSRTAFAAVVTVLKDLGTYGGRVGVPLISDIFYHLKPASNATYSWRPTE